MSNNVLIVEQGLSSTEKLLKEVRYSMILPDWLAFCMKINPKVYWQSTDKDWSTGNNANTWEQILKLNNEEMKKLREDANKGVLNSYRIPLPKPVQLSWKPLPINSDGAEAKVLPFRKKDGK